MNQNNETVKRDKRPYIYASLEGDEWCIIRCEGDTETTIKSGLSRDEAIAYLTKQRAK